MATIVCQSQRLDDPLSPKPTNNTNTQNQPTNQPNPEHWGVHLVRLACVWLSRFQKPAKSPVPKIRQTDQRVNPPEKLILLGQLATTNSAEVRLTLAGLASFCACQMNLKAYIITRPAGNHEQRRNPFDTGRPYKPLSLPNEA